MVWLKSPRRASVIEISRTHAALTIASYIILALIVGGSAGYAISEVFIPEGRPVAYDRDQMQADELLMDNLQRIHASIDIIELNTELRASIAYNKLIQQYASRLENALAIALHIDQHRTHKEQ